MKKEPYDSIITGYFKGAISAFKEFWRSRLNRVCLLAILIVSVMLYWEVKAWYNRRRYIRARKALLRNRPIQRLIRACQTLMGGSIYERATHDLLMRDAKIGGFNKQHTGAGIINSIFPFSYL